MKQKLLLLTIISAIIFSVFPTVAAAEEPDARISIINSETNTEAEYILPYKDIDLSFSSNKSIGLLGICYYGGNGALTDFKFLNDVRNYSEHITVNEQTYKIKVIGWDSLETMCPAIISKEISREFLPTRPKGLGTQDEPFVITTTEELSYIFAENTKHYELASDINLENTVWYSATFSGILDGKGHTVTNLKTADYLKTTGLVSNLKPQTVSDLSNSSDYYIPTYIKNLNVEIDHSGNDAEISGGIAGKMVSASAIILNCTVMGNITSSYISGGIVGENTGGQIEECKSTANVTVSNEGDIFAGGITGVSLYYVNDEYPRIVNCNSSGVIQSFFSDSLADGYHSMSGGITAYNSGYIKNCQSTAKLYSNEKTGGIAAETSVKIENRCDIVDCIDNTTVINSSSTIFDGGDGSKENPYRISNAEQLNTVRDFLSASFVQTCDIDLSELTTAVNAPYWNEGKGWIPIGTEAEPYTGNYDGNGYRIIGMNINSAYEHMGLFGYSRGVIKNLGLIDGGITVSGKMRNSGYNLTVGMLVGENSGTVANCYNLSSVSATDELSGILNISAGGISGRNYGTIEKCYNMGNISITQNISAPSSSDIPSSLWLSGGGISGETKGGIIKNCFNRGEISCSVPYSDLDVPFEEYQLGLYNNTTGFPLPTVEESIGGIVGYSNNGKIQNCYTSGRQTAYSVYGAVYIDMGRVVGLCNNASAYIDNCYWNANSPTLINGVQVTDDTTVSGIKIKAYGISMLVSEMKSADFVEKLGTAFGADVSGQNDGYSILVQIVNE